MEKEKLEEIKKNRTKLGCSLSTIRREIKNSSLSESQLKNKISRGLKMATQHKELSTVLIQHGYKCDSKVPYTNPEWWANYNTSSDEVACIVKAYEPDKTESDETINILQNIIKSNLKEALDEFFDEQKYLLNVAWTDSSNEYEEELNNLLSIIDKYLISVDARLKSFEHMANESIRIYEYAGKDYNIIKKTILFFIDQWGQNTDMAFFGRLCRF